ncbi:MAG: hypothetical protein K8I60_00480 [Anaerolineae bacterium]|nr:hypothetical protein [Anaerolineae bacterium]
MKGRRSVFSGVLLITAAVILVAVGFAARLDNQCQSALESGLPVYPGAELTAKETQFLRYRSFSYYSPDSPAEITSWYTRTLALAARAALDNNTRAWTGEWTVTPADPQGSNILLSKRCS